MSIHPGATWRCVDLQCHTPRDIRWSGSPPLPGGTPESELARQAWANDFVAAALGKGLTVVAITDHHDTAFLPYVMQAAADDGDRLVVLPGMEVTCSDGVQCLVIFERDTTEEDWRRLLTKFPAIVPHGKDEPRTAPTTECGRTIAELFNDISADTVLESRVLLLPHFGNPGAHKSLNDSGHTARARDLPCDGVYIECAYHELDQGTLDKIQGKQAEWGARRRAIVATGDNKRASWDRLGAHECWIRMGENTIESLRQAFLADEARIFYTRPQVPSERIVELEVLSKLTGVAPMRVTFNEGFTAFIGGRGSGKSAMLEYLAFALGKAESDNSPEDSKPVRRREREAALIQDTLADGGWVKITIDREGVRETWLRTGAKPGEITVTVAGGTETHSVAAAQVRFPARAFHQKELSTTMVNPETAADNITLIAAAEVIEDRLRIERDISKAKRAVVAALLEIAAHWQTELELTAARNLVADLKRRLASIVSQMEAGGIKAEDLRVLADAPRYGRAENYLADLKRILAEDLSRVERAAADYLVFDAARYADATTFPSIHGLATTIAEARTEVMTHFAAAAAALRNLDASRVGAETSFKIEAEAFEVVYQGAKGRQAEHSALIADSERLTGELHAATAVESLASEAELRKQPSVEAFADAQKELHDLVKEKLEVLKAAAARIAEKSDGTLTARKSQDRKPQECVDALCTMLEGSRFRDTEQHVGDWVAATFAPNAATDWVKLCSELVTIYRKKIMAGSPPEPSAEAATAIRQLFFDGSVSLTAQQTAKIYTNLNDQTIGPVLAATPRDGIVLTYMSDGMAIAFSKASSGQQASALLRLLLRQSAGTLIIDQPEDDLDNKVMMDIVRLIRKSKTSRQLIFSTHNSNLVVNGDADKVIVMRATVPEDRAGADTARIRADVDGAIETPRVRDEITHIMEGGMEAFDLRSRKYGN
jgi:predicted metal-dependent phosphoesterase TrpH/ABC-type lipoprotein export system ATPase subunit